MFLNSHRQRQLDIGSSVFAAEEGRVFELECTSNRNDIALSLEQNGVLIDSGKYTDCNFHGNNYLVHVFVVLVTQFSVCFCVTL